MEKYRKDFEKYAITKQLDTRTYSKELGYAFMETQIAFEAYCAGRLLR